MTHDDPHLDHLLAEGGASGPALDRVWDRLDASLDEAGIGAPAPARAWWQRLSVWASGGGVLAAAAAVLFMVSPVAPGPADAGLARRGERTPLEAQAAWLETNCGARDDACAVGAPIAIRVRGGAAPVRVQVVLEDHAGVTPLSNPFEVAAGALEVLPALVEPEAQDAASGLKLKLFVVDEAGARAPVPAAVIALHVEARRVQVEGGDASP